MKVMLINPPQKLYAASFDLSISFPIGLLSIAATIRNHSDIRIMDCLVDRPVLDRHNDYSIFGTPDHLIIDAVKEYGPDLVGISIPFSAQSEIAQRTCRMLKRELPNLRIVTGGPDVSVRYRELLLRGVCDYCVPGEGERAFLALVEACATRGDAHGVAGVASVRNGAVAYNCRAPATDLDSLPLPAYDMINVDAYLASPYLYSNRGNMTGPAMSMVTSRGCPFDCIFCSVGSHMGQQYRSHSVDYVMRHLTLLVNTYGIRRYHFEDDNISLHAGRFEALMDAIIAAQLDISWDLPNGIKADTLSKQAIAKMHEAGCKELRVAIESAQQETLDNIIHKKLDLPKALDVLRECKKIGLPSSAFYVIGFPGETVADMRKTVDLALEMDRKHDVLPVLLVATPLFGTELHRICSEQGYIKEPLTEKDLACGTHILGNHLIGTNDFSPRDIDRLGRRYALRYVLNHPERAVQKVRNRIRKLFGTGPRIVGTGPRNAWPFARS